MAGRCFFTLEKTKSIRIVESEQNLIRKSVRLQELTDESMGSECANVSVTVRRRIIDSFIAHGIAVRKRVEKELGPMNLSLVTDVFENFLESKQRFLFDNHAGKCCFV